MRHLTPILAAAALLALASCTAAAGDGEPAMDRFEGQHLEWRECRSGPDDDTGRALDEAGARCATFTAPLDYARPGGDTITVTMSRLEATDPEQRHGVLMLNGGGPGGSDLDMPLELANRAALSAHYDLIGMEIRSTGRTAAVDCGWQQGTWLRSMGATRAAFDEEWEHQAGLAEQCGESSADLLPHITTRNIARDMDLARVLLGETTVSYLGYSYGTYLGQVYMSMFPGSVDRIVLDGVIDPVAWEPNIVRGAGDAAARALDEWARWTAERDDEFGLGATGEAVTATVVGIMEASAEQPLTVGEYEVDVHVVPFLLYAGLAFDDDGSHAELAAAVALLRDAAETGEAVEPTEALEAQLAFALTGDESGYGSAQAAIMCGDNAVATTDPQPYWEDIESHLDEEPVFAGLTRTAGPCVFWPAAATEDPVEAVTSDLPVMLVSAREDTRTVHEQAEAVHEHLGNSVLVTLESRVHGVYNW
jgi:pimeloyl-ACP methyl ester carboxylesterase